MQVIAIDGAKATGKSTHVEALAAALRTRGFSVHAFIRPFASNTSEDRFIAALAETSDRLARLLKKTWADDAVLIFDGWTNSTLMLGRALTDEGASGEDEMIADAFKKLFVAEMHRIIGADIKPALLVALDASDVALDARFSLRSAEVTPLDRSLRDRYRAYVSNVTDYKWNVVDTTYDHEIVEMEILSLALKALRGKGTT